MWVLLALVTALSMWAVTQRFRLDPNIAGLLPERGESAALRQYLRAYGGSDLGMVLVADPTKVGLARGAPPPPQELERVAREVAEALQALPAVRVAAAGIDAEGQLDPMLVWRHADATARGRLADALALDAMRARLRTSRSMLLAPGSGLAAVIAQDPLRLQQLLAESQVVGSGFRTQADGSFASDDGRARLVLVFPAGQALRGDDAKAFVAEVTPVLDRFRAEHPSVYLGLTGGHAIGAATERMLRRDLIWSSNLSMLLASLAFLLTFRRLRAIVAVFPPLVLGSLWTAGVASLWPGGLSAIAVSFMSVVIGVGVDTGVHVYAALLEARQEGLSPTDAARRARARTQKPVLVAATTAGAAFAALALSEIAALRQLGLLCASGEILTALGIVLVTPVIGARLERKPPPEERRARWTELVARLTATRGRAIACLVLTALPMLGLVLGHGPRVADAIVAMRPRGLEPLTVQQRVYDAFGGRTGQWVILVTDEDPQRARARADQITEALVAEAEHLESLDALTALAPARSTQEARFAARDALDMTAAADRLERALSLEGFAPARFEAVLASMRHPPRRFVTLEDIRQREDNEILLQRYLGRDGPLHTVVVYALPKPGHEAPLEAAVAAADPKAAITGYGRLESALRSTLLVDLPKVGLVAAAMVVLALAFALRRPRDVGLALAVVAGELGIVLWLVGALDVPLHAYDALVLPVLLGITVDEAMFLLFRARQSGDDVHETLRREGPPVATTALTTAAGFAGLLICDFDGLRHLGAVGAIGSVMGLVVAVVVVPAGMRLLPRR